MASPNIIKLSSPATREYWEISVLFEDDHLLALDKPARLLISPDRDDRDRASLMKLLHRGIEQGVRWAKERGYTYLANAHRLDSEASGVLLLAKNKPALIAMANQFSSEKPVAKCVALVHGMAEESSFEVDLKLAPDPVRPGMVRPDSEQGKRSITRFEVAERFQGFTLLNCYPLTSRTHQIRVHLQSLGLPLVGDELYGGGPLLLSRLKSGYRMRLDREETPLIGRAALHAERLSFSRPITGEPIAIEAPWPKDLMVGLKYLRRFAGG